MTIAKINNQRDVQAAKAAEALRYQERAKPDSQWFRNWQYALYWRSLNASERIT
ncbi:MAG: hypothetical protein HY273_12900 [Gammaproteobacteria bacterium]|nr:hypothetical protein [Gammaproteobacteria bacterium]